MNEPTRNEKLTVGTTAIEIALDRNEETPRKLMYLKNTSTGIQKITVSMGKVAIANEGIVLDVGEIVIDSESEAYVPYQGKISAISSAAGGQLSIFER
jgi:hypothetical protein